MDLVDGHGALPQILLAALRHPRPVIPCVFVCVPNDRGGPGSEFCSKGVRIGLYPQVTPFGLDLVFVERPLADPGNEYLPDAGSPHGPHGKKPAVPIVEVADDTDALGIGCPHGKCHASHAVHLASVGAQLFVQPVMSPLP